MGKVSRIDLYLHQNLGETYVNTDEESELLIVKLKVLTTQINIVIQQMLITGVRPI